MQRFPGLPSTISSACNRQFTPGSSQGKSLIKCEKRGPKTGPCGTWHEKGYLSLNSSKKNSKWSLHKIIWELWTYFSGEFMLVECHHKKIMADIFKGPLKVWKNSSWARLFPYCYKLNILEFVWNNLFKDCSNGISFRYCTEIICCFGYW